MTPDPSTPRTSDAPACAEWVAGGLRIVADASVTSIEVKRRTDAQAPGGFRHLDTLRFLLTIPLNEAVQESRFSGYEMTLARRASRALLGVETATNEHERLFTRIAQPPVWISLVTVRGPATRRTLRLASSFAPYAARRIVATGPVNDSLAVEARYYGVGISTIDERVIVSPAPFRPSRFTGASWLFAEQAYEHLAPTEPIEAHATARR